MQHNEHNKHETKGHNTSYPLKGVVERLDMEDIPIGSIVKTPSGRVGTVVKHRGAQSRHDLFQRIIVEFDEPYGDSVALQPHLLTILQKP
ncbi:MAG: hypothetical protein Q8R65_07235 [Polynucleobacter sp.]|nr:hypothetical protein [Polynucleobacter sp.]MDZ4057657.1 hypothetical protein [Polynucleobacter sp.]